MKQRAVLLLLPLSLVLIVVLACGSTPETPVSTEPVSQAAPVQAAPVQTAPAPQPVPPPVEQVFNPGNITEEQFEIAKEEVQALIADLNLIIRARNYQAWLTHLSESYFQEISSAAFLEERTEDLFRRDQTVARNLGRDPRMVERRVLRTPMDFFTHVVVPARSNDRVDDIDFVSENRVIAYTIDARGNRLILYNLEVIDGKWRIVS